MLFAQASMQQLHETGEQPRKGSMAHGAKYSKRNSTGERLPADVSGSSWKYPSASGPVEAVKEKAGRGVEEIESDVTSSCRILMADVVTEEPGLLPPPQVSSIIVVSVSIRPGEKLTLQSGNIGFYRRQIVRLKPKEDMLTVSDSPIPREPKSSELPPLDDRYQVIAAKELWNHESWRS